MQDPADKGGLRPDSCGGSDRFRNGAFPLNISRPAGQDAKSLRSDPVPLEAAIRFLGNRHLDEVRLKGRLKVGETQVVRIF